MSDMDKHRARAHLIFIALLWLHVPLNAAVALLMDGPWIVITASSLATAAIATATWLYSPNQRAVRVTNSIALVVTVSILLATTSGSAWQVDLHMYYFAALALVAVYCDSYAIVAATGTVAVHHLLLNFVLPSLIYPGGEDFSRVVLHAVILVVEAAGLVWMSQMLQGAFQRAGRALKDARQAQGAAENTNLQLQETQAAERESIAEQEKYRETVAAQQSAMVAVLADNLAKIANGDLTTRIVEGFDGDFKEIKKDFNAAISKLTLAMLGVLDGVRIVRSGTHQMTVASGDLARRNEQQAANLEQTAAALDEITATVKRSADSAKHARDIVVAADQDAKRSATVVDEAVSAMNGISQSSRQIVQIIGVIDEIAFQTNLLALNAGVEAARAGESGRGFAVVASEVRALALRSADAAKEIKELISTSTTQVDHGSKLVSTTGQALKRIADQVAELSVAVSNIAEGAKDQASGLGEINTAINQMDQMTQQNAAMAAEATAACRSLSDEGERLSELVTQFELGESNATGFMRQESKRVAGHALRGAASIRNGGPPNASHPASRPVALKVANGRARAVGNEI
jgi:methyl-accepting chemotaxis protein